MKSIILLCAVCVAFTAMRECVECRTIRSFDSKIIRQMLPIDRDSRVIGENVLRTKREITRVRLCSGSNNRIGPLCVPEKKRKFNRNNKRHQKN